MYARKRSSDFHFDNNIAQVYAPLAIIAGRSYVRILYNRVDAMDFGAWA